MEPATGGDSIFQYAFARYHGLNHDLCLPWGSRPRLYAYAACFAGWAILQNLSLRFLLGQVEFLCKAMVKDHSPLLVSPVRLPRIERRKMTGLFTPTTFEL